jgi:hypothetical protein
MKEWSKDERFYPEASLFLEGLFESSSWEYREVQDLGGNIFDKHFVTTDQLRQIVQIIFYETDYRNLWGDLWLVLLW